MSFERMEFSPANDPGPEKPAEKIQSTREYAASSVIEDEIAQTKVVFEKEITADTKICLIGDGQGADTRKFIEMGVAPGSITSVNYELSEVEQANSGVLADTGVEMRQANVVDFDSLMGVGIGEASQDVIVLMHVLEVPDIRGEAERNLVQNISRVLREGGEALVTQYRRKLTPEEAELFGVEEIAAESLRSRFGEDWQEAFRQQYGQNWHEGMRYSEISNIRSKGELMQLFEDGFEIRIEESGDEFILRLKKK